MKKPLGKYLSRTDTLIETVLECVHWVYRDRRRYLLNTVMNFEFHKKWKYRIQDG
jgi:hypothetical protein